MNRILRVLPLGLVTILALALALPARAVLINFDAPADGTIIDSFYPSATFTNPIGGNIYARASAFNTSVPLRTPLSNNTGTRPFTASTISGSTSSEDGA